MDSLLFSRVPEKLKYDLRVFGFEMYSYMMERRYFDQGVPHPVSLTEESQFTEEVGKAFMVAWRENFKKYRKMITLDYPRFAVMLDNFVRYTADRALDIVRHSTGDMAKTIAEVSAFLIELVRFCEIGERREFLRFIPPYFPEFWGVVVLECFGDNFEGEFPWSWLHCRCKEESLKYDKNYPEKTDHDNPARVLLRTDYFNSDLVKSYERVKFYSKLVSKFHVLDSNNKVTKALLPHGSVSFQRRIDYIDEARRNSGDEDLLRILDGYFNSAVFAEKES